MKSLKIVYHQGTDSLHLQQQQHDQLRPLPSLTLSPAVLLCQELSKLTLLFIKFCFTSVCHQQVLQIELIMLHKRVSTDNATPGLGELCRS